MHDTPSTENALAAFLAAFRARSHFDLGDDDDDDDAFDDDDPEDDWTR